MTLLAGRLLLVLIALSLAVAPVAAQSLDIAGPYGNADGCKFAKSGQMDSDDTLLLKADGFQSYGTACEFVQVLKAKDGSKVVVGLCAFEGEDGFGTQNFVIRKSQKDPAALIIYSNNGEVFGEVDPCP
jgi:hypothetical protein